MARRVLLDANVLLLLYVGVLDRDLIQRFKRTRDYTPDDFDLLKLIVDWHSELVTTPHILAEVSNLADHLTEPLRSALFESFAVSIGVLREAYTPAVVLAQSDVFSRLGLADSAIAKLARDEDLLVVTADKDLHVHLLAIGARAVNFKHTTALARFVEELSAR